MKMVDPFDIFFNFCQWVSESVIEWVSEKVSPREAIASKNSPVWTYKTINGMSLEQGNMAILSNPKTKNLHE